MKASEMIDICIHIYIYIYTYANKLRAQGSDPGALNIGHGVKLRTLVLGSFRVVLQRPGWIL